MVLLEEKNSDRLKSNVSEMLTGCFYFVQRKDGKGPSSPRVGGGKERTVNMALFKRRDLEGKGLSGEQIDYILTESNRALAADYMPKSALQEEIEKSLQANPPKVDITKNEDYIKVVGERDMLRAISGEEYAGIKPKFRETVYKMIDRSEDAPSLEDQLGKVKEGFEEYFIPSEPVQETKKTPVFSKPNSTPQTNETEEDKLYAKMMDHWGR